jgi:hypothetical protein
MMDLPLYPDGYAPRPPGEVEFETVELVVYPDRRRVFLHVVVTPFLERPNLLLTARGPDGAIAAEMSVIETMHHDMEFTMHLRRPGDTAGEYTLTLDLYYESRNPPQARHETTFVVPEAAEPPAG